MSKFRTFIVSSLAVAGLAFAGCEKRSPNADTQAKGTTESTAPADRTPSSLDRQPVSGSDDTAGSAVPSTAGSTSTGYGTADQGQAPTAAPMGTGDTATTTTTTTTSDLYWTDEDGTRHMLHDSALITQVQQKLSTSGAYRGATDGKTSPELAAAIRDFQKKQGLPETGTIDRKTADAMGLDWSKFSAEGESKTIGDTVRGAASDLEQKANEVSGDIQRTAGEAEAGAESARQDFEAGAKELGRDVEEGANKAAGEIQEGARDVKRELDDTSK
jgi:peptidoglycan hydrolase-like protein with peptidoglycan-binding domain